MMNEIQNIVNKVHTLLNNKELQEKGKLPSNAYFLNADEVVCFPREFGDSRYPYAYDGLTLWAYASGNVKIEESAFNVLLDFDNGQEPTLAFFYGIKTEDGFYPVSITGAAKQPMEKNISRYTVYTPECAYYITESKNLLGAVRMTVDGNKVVRMDVYLENTSSEEQKTYVSAYMNCILSNAGFADFYSKCYRSCEKLDDGFMVKVTDYWANAEHYAKIKRTYDGEVYTTTSMSDYKGGSSNQLISAIPLFTGEFKHNKPYTIFVEQAVAGDMIPLALKAGESVTVSYALASADSESEVIAIAEKPFKVYGGGNIYADIPKVELDGDLSVKNETLAYFIKNALRQTEFCSRSKNYAGAFIGIRDIFQQLECGLVWMPEYCKKKMVEALGYIGEDGRPPRQYSYSRSANVPPAMDLRKYIDQGVWVISTFYRYITVTGDFSVLDEECGYYKLGDRTVAFSTERDSVLCHLIRIAEYLISNLDEQTGCLHILYGDWNDAVDGLGRTTDKDKQFGTGVSVMATLQLYKNLNELCEILRYTGKDGERIERYESIANNILAGLKKYAIAENGKGEKKVVHGWGDNLSYKIGSFCDNDGVSRDSATANAFWVLSGVNDSMDMKEHIVKAYERMDSKYGIKTFEPYFAPENKDVGRITSLPKGTAENGATYIHGTLFTIWSLFEMGEYDKAWEQIFKILPITHELISTSPFVMPNSYAENPEQGMDGESMSDWFTGSGCVLGKVLFFCVFGVRPNLQGVEICPAINKKFNKLQTTLSIKGGEITVIYRYVGQGKRTFMVNGNSVCGEYNTKYATDKIMLSNEEISGKKIVVEICD